MNAKSKTKMAESVYKETQDRHIVSCSKEQAKKKLQELIKEETKTVKGIFKFYETPGGSTRIQVRKYPGIPPFDMVMQDGQTYEVPLYIARHLNGIDKSASAIKGKVHTCSYPIHGFRFNQGQDLPRSAEGPGGAPVPISGIVSRKQRYGFQSLEFENPMDDEAVNT